MKVGKFAVTDVECTIVPPAKLGHTVGYWEKPGLRTIENFVGVVTPKDLDQDTVYPKEQALIDICKKQKAEGVQTWVYVQMSGKRNIQPRLKMLLEREGLKVGILRADDVEPIERENWIAQHGREFDVMISHPQLVSTGLDLFSKSQGGHNYATIVFYETGYNLFTMRQAARRAWRIGQPRDCRVYYLYYKDTMQHKAMSLMSRKMAAAQALEGEFSEDGLAAMAGEDNLQMALAKNLADRIDSADMQRSWGKVKSGPKKKPKASPLDKLPPALQLVGESLIESQSRPVPPEAAAEFPQLHEEIARIDEAFKAATADIEVEADEMTEEQIAESDTMHAAHPVVTPSDPDEESDLFDELCHAEFDEEEAAFNAAVERAQTADPEPATPEELAAKAIRLYEPDDEDEDSDVPELTEDILAKMFANMMAAGQWAD